LVLVRLGLLVGVLLMLVVGSTALEAYSVRIGRKPRDIDLIATHEEIFGWLEKNHLQVKRQNVTETKYIFLLDDGRILEFELAKGAGLWLLENYGGLGYSEVHTEFGVAVHPDVVLALKLSHRYRKNSPYFLKTMNDILSLRGLKFRVPLALRDWFEWREKETYDYSHPSLKRDKGKFFSGDGINYVYEHDDIHEALATLKVCDHEEWNIRPAYVQFQKDSSVDVSVSREKWNRCTEWTKLNSVLEESYVLALERSQIPNDFGMPPRVSFLIALEKVCTSITSGWWREYAWEHYYQVLGMYSDDYVDKFQKALAEGRIRPYQGKAA
jgi:hypothetical protein